MEIENARTMASNATLHIERVARRREIGNRVFAKLQTALRENAPTLLNDLMEANRHLDEGGAPIAESYDGIKMFLELKAKKNDKVSDADARSYEHRYEEIRDSKPPDNVEPRVWSKRINNFQGK